MKSFPMIRFVVQHGRRLSLMCAMLLTFCSVWWFVRSQNIVFLLIGLFLTLALSSLLRLMSEIVEVVADALLPR